MAGSKDEVKVKAKKSGKPATTAGGEPRLPKKLYERELFRLQAELVKLQEWVRAERARVVVIFEGRDAAGKGSTIKRVTQYLNPRVAQITALPAPTEREQTSGTSSVISSICRPAGRSCCSTAAGTTARGSSA